MSIPDPVELSDESLRAERPYPVPDLRFPVVGLGASAGGLGALTRFFQHMPADSGMAFVVVLHLAPDHDSSVPAILQRATRAPVIEVKQPVDVLKNHVYVISPARGLRMVDGRLRVDVAERPRGRAVAIDIFFRTLAEAHRERAVSIVLSGSGSDGTVGMTRIKEQGGLALVQSPDDAEFDGMPRSAIATGMADFVLPVVEMPQKLIDLWHNARRIVLPQGASLMPGIVEDTAAKALGATETVLREILTLLHARTGHDFGHFNRLTLLRRLERRLQVNQLPDLPAYLARLQTQPRETEGLLSDLLIGVTNFFRDRGAFEALERAIADTFFADGRPRGELRAWVAGCATGEEAYSAAMLLHERSRAARRTPLLQVLASDIDARALDLARQGVYPASIAADVSSRRLRQFFTLDGDRYRVNAALRDGVVFGVHDLLRDPPFSRIDVACCRNLLSLLDRESQAHALSQLHYALQPGGLLLLGDVESIEPAEALFTPIDGHHRLYRATGPKRPAQAMPLQAAALPPMPPPVPDLEPPPLAQLHQRLFDSHGPASVLVDAEADILHLSPGAARYLRHVGGAPSHNLLVAVLDEMRIPLRTALSLALREGRSVEARRVQLQRAGQSVRLDMTAHPVRDPSSGASVVLVLFSEVEASLAAAAEAGSQGSAGSHAQRDAVQAELETELQRTRELLQGSLGASRASSEELRASNEELQAMNEELRSTTEALQTSREELQSLNEELATVNQELKQRVDQTGMAHDDLQNLILASDVAAVFVDRGLVLRRFTPRATEVFDLREADLGRSLLDIAHGLDGDGFEKDVEQALRSVQARERELAGKGGRAWRMKVQPYRTQENRIDGAVLSFADISADRRAEAAPRQAELHRWRGGQPRSDPARAAVSAAEHQPFQAAASLKDEWLSVMSQELRHPLNLIHVNAELLSRMPEARSLPKVARAAAVIRATVMRQAQVIDDLLDLSLLASGGLPLEGEPMDWLRVIERVGDALQGDAAARQLTLERQLDRAAALVHADAPRVEQIVWNLLRNALRFTPAGGHVRLVLTSEGDRSRLDVSDDGQGLAAGVLPHVFEVFGQADRRGARRDGGRGFGLALVRQLSEQMGGAVAAASGGIGQGATFSVWLPRSGIVA